MALAAVVTGEFSAGEALIDFALAAVVGVAIGAAVGALLEWAFPRIADPSLGITLALFGAYFSYLPAELLEGSAVLAVVTTGVWVGWRTPASTRPGARLAGGGF